MGEKVYVTLPRTVSFREEEGGPELAYGPGRAQIPLPLAESLKEWGIISEWSTSAPTTPDTSPIKPSDELAADFPGREYLYMAGYTSYGQVAELDKEELVALPGIGAATADKILAAMDAAKTRMPPIAPAASPPHTRRQPYGAAGGGDDGAAGGGQHGTQPDAS